MKKLPDLGVWANNPNEAQYLEALKATYKFGNMRETRNGNTHAIFAWQMRFNMQKGFTAVTTKLLQLKSVFAELLWFLDAGKETGGRLSLKRLNQIQGKPADAKNIWTHDQERFAKAGKAQFDGDCGAIYGSQWRNFNGEGVDQIANVISAIKKDPFSRYHIVTAWNPLKLHDMCLPPCHMKFQFFVRRSRRKDKKMYLDLMMDQRSVDMLLGEPFNIASYALLLAMIAQCVDMIPGELVITLNDCHIYAKHMKQVRTQLGRNTFKAPKLWLNPEIKDIDSFTMDDIKLIDYKHHEAIKAPLL